MIIIYLLLLPFAYYFDYKKNPKQFTEDLKGAVVFTVIQILFVLFLKFFLNYNMLIVVMSLAIEILLVFSIKACIKN